MTAVFEKILEMSGMAAVVIVVVMLIRLCLRKAPRKYSYALWSVAAFRLVCPVSFKSMFSIFRFANMVEKTEIRETIDHTILGLPNDVGFSPAPAVSTPPVTVTTPAPTLSVLPTVNVELLPEPEVTFDLAAHAMDIAAIVWLAGLAALLIYGIVSYVRLRRRMSASVLLEGNVWQSDRVQSPFILGFICPKIYLPFGLSADQQRYVLAHERYHLKRLDHIVRPLSFLILAAHWFNPLVWVAYYMMSRDMEMSCDEKVLSGEDNIRKAYSITLLSFAANRRFPSPSPLAFGESGVKGRIKNVLNWRKPRTWVTIIAIIVCIVVIIVCAANPSAHPHDWSGSVTVEEVESVELYIPTGNPQRRRLSEREIEELIAQLNQVTRSEYRTYPKNASWSFPTERMITITSGGVEYVLNLGTSPMTISCKDERVDWRGETHWGVSNEELKQFIRDLPEGETAVRPADGYYHSVECVFMFFLSSVVATADSGYLYLLESDGGELRLISKSDGAVYPYAADGDWQELSDEFLHKMEEGTITIGGTDLWDTLREERPMIRLYVGDYKFLLNFGDELWEGTYYYDHNGNISLWSLYRLELVSVIDADDLDISPEYQVLYSALYDGVEIVDTGLGVTDVLSKLVAATSPDVEIEITKIAAVDLDGDGVRELLLLIETPGTVYGTKILRYNTGDGQIYAYDLWYRAFMDVKTDGTFAYSGGASDNGFGRISFTTDGYEVEKITCMESLYPGHEVNCYVNGESATEQEFTDAFALWQETSSVTWAEYDSVNALRLLRENPAAEEPETTTELSRFLADLTHDGVQETITLNYHEEWRNYTLTVSNSAGEIIWTGEANLAHVGWNGLYLYQKDNRNYLMRWLPGGSTGSFSYYYQIFSLSEDGTELLLAENNFRFDAMSVETVLSIDVDGIRAFEKEVNALLEDTIVLITTDEGTPYYSTQDATLCRLWAAPVKEVQEWKQNAIDRLPLVMAYMVLEPELLARVEEQVATHMGDHDLAYVERVEEIGQSAYRVTYKPGDYDGVSRVTWQDSRYIDIIMDGNKDYDLSSMTQVDSLPDEEAALYADADGRLILQIGECIGPISDDVWPMTATGISVTLAKTDSGSIALRCRNQAILDVSVPVTWSEETDMWVRNGEFVDNTSEESPIRRGMEEKLNEAVSEQVSRYYSENLRQSGGTGHGQFVVLDKAMDNLGATAYVVAFFIEMDGNGSFMAEYANIPMVFTFELVNGEYVLTQSWVEEKEGNFDAHDQLKARFPPAAAQAVMDDTYTAALRQSVIDSLDLPVEMTIRDDAAAVEEVLYFAYSHICSTYSDAQAIQVESVEEIPTGAVGTVSGHLMYRLVYDVMLDGRWHLLKEIYLVLHTDWSSSSEYWYFCGTVTQEEIDTTYSNEAILEKYSGDPYLAAVVETVNQWRSNR